MNEPLQPPPPPSVTPPPPTRPLVGAMLGLAWDGLKRKFGRNFLTALGVIIGVLALTLIVALGRGMADAMRDALETDDTRRQILVTPGFGQPDEAEDADGNAIDRIDDVEVDADVPPERLDRLRRAKFQRRFRTRHSAQPTLIDDERLAALAELEAVERVVPLISTRLNLNESSVPVPKEPNRSPADQPQTDEADDAGDADADDEVTLLAAGVDAVRQRYADRVVAGVYFSAPDADQALIHEYTLYQWGYVTDAEIASVIGATITVEPALEGLGRLREMMGGGGGDDDGDDGAKTDEEQLDELIDRMPAARMFPGFDEFRRQLLAREPRTFTIVGVFRDAGTDDTFNFIEDPQVFQADLLIPAPTAREVYRSSPTFPQTGYQTTLVMVDSPAAVETVVEQIEDQELRAINVSTVLTQIESVLTALTVFVGLLIGIALLVAALGIVNTMFTSVLERTKEIGLYKAIGATDGQVRTAFVLEAAMIGLMGGLIGLGLAVLLMLPGQAIADSLIAQETGGAGGSFSIFSVPWWLVVAGPALATLVAMLAALIPAWRAANIDPVRALRSE
jgi:putative ABC transport system permease protein